MGNESKYIIGKLYKRILYVILSFYITLILNLKDKIEKEKRPTSNVCLMLRAHRNTFKPKRKKSQFLYMYLTACVVNRTSVEIPCKMRKI